jgi:methylamine utilization protein MauE
MVEIFLRVLLGGLLAGAALAKLASPRESIAALDSFGFGDGPVRPIAVAVLIGSNPAAWAAAALMLLFAALTAAALLRGRAGAPCACFGPRSTVSWLGVVRNLGLALGFALIPLIDADSIGTDGWLGISVTIALLACAGLTVAVALEIPEEGPEIGTVASELASRIGVNGAQFRLAVFTSEGCRICQTLAPAIENVAKDPRVEVAVFDEVAESGLWRALGIPGSPFALALDENGTVLAKGTFNSLAQLESVLATAERRESPSGA